MSIQLNHYTESICNFSFPARIISAVRIYVDGCGHPLNSRLHTFDNAGGCLQTWKLKTNMLKDTLINTSWQSSWSWSRSWPPSPWLWCSADRRLGPASLHQRLEQLQLAWTCRRAGREMGRGSLCLCLCLCLCWRAGRERGPGSWRQFFVFWAASIFVKRFLKSVCLYMCVC